MNCFANGIPKSGISCKRRESAQTQAAVPRFFSSALVPPITGALSGITVAPFLAIWNHPTLLLGQAGEISQEPVAVEFGTPEFGLPQAARDPRFIQFAMKFHF